MKKEKTEIKIVKIKECVPNSWNPNEMNARQFASLKKALTKYGQTKPIQVGVWPNMKVKDGYVIVGGFHTWKLAYELTQNGYSIKEIASNLGEEDINVKDALDLVKDEIEKKMIELKKAERENTIVLNFIVDKDPEASADEFIKAVTAFAKAKGVKVEKAVKDINKQRETIALVSFNVTNPQKGVIDEALNALSKESKMTESEAIAEVCSRFINTQNGNIQKQDTTK